LTRKLAATWGQNSGHDLTTLRDEYIGQQIGDSTGERHSLDDSCSEAWGNRRVLASWERWTVMEDARGTKSVPGDTGVTTENVICVDMEDLSDKDWDELE
jgi:hypothetical protein